MDTHRYRPTFVEIRLDRLRKNFSFFSQSLFAKKFLCPMVKANAYGHGDIQVVKFLESLGCQNFGVGLVEEGLHLRQAGVSTPNIYVFGFSGAEAVQEILQNHLYPIVSDWSQLQLLEKYAKSKTSFHLKINTGMNRLGFSADDLEKVLDFILHSHKLHLTGVCTHLMSAEDLNSENGISFQQIHEFSQLIDQYHLHSLTAHVYNSHGFLNALNSEQCRTKYQFGVRPGLALWGVHPDSQDQSQQLYPVAQLKSKIVSVQKIRKGSCVSYGATWKAAENTTVGIVPIGYADGVPVQLSNQGQVIVNGRRVPIIGRVCMDYTLVNLGLNSQDLGQDVEFFGSQISIHDVAKNSNTIVWDILTRLSERVPRIFIGKEN